MTTIETYRERRRTVAKLLVEAVSSGENKWALGHLADEHYDGWRWTVPRREGGLPTWETEVGAPAAASYFGLPLLVAASLFQVGSERRILELYGTSSPKITLEHVGHKLIELESVTWPSPSRLPTPCW